MTKWPRGALLRGEPRRQAYGDELALDERTAWCGRLIHLETDVLCLEEGARPSRKIGKDASDDGLLLT